MSYQKSAAIRSTSLKELIVGRTLQGRGFGTSIASSIKDKTVANIRGITEKFDPLNIGRAFGGRLGAYAVGKLTGRSKEDISYFTGSSGGRASPMKNRNPLITKVSDGEKRPMKKGDGLADVMARIFNLLKQKSEHEKMELELLKPLKEQEESEREKRHKELLEAITGIKSGKLTKVTESKKSGFFGDLLKSVKDMIENFKKILGPLLDFTEKIGKLGFKALTSFLSLIGTSGVLTFLLPAAAAAALLWLAKQTKEEIEANPNDPKFKDNPYAMTLRGEAKSVAEAGKRNANEVKLQVPRNQVEEIVKANLPQEDYIREYGATKEVLQTWLDKSKDEKSASWQKPVKNAKGQITTKAGPVGSDLRVSAAELSGQTTSTARTSGSAPGAPSSISPSYFKEPSKLQETSTPTPLAPDRSSRRIEAAIEEDFYQNEVKNAKLTTTATPAPAAPDRSSRRIQAAIRESQDLELQDSKPQTIVIDKSKVITTGGSSGSGLTVEESAPVRIDDLTLRHIQERNLRKF